MIITILTIIFWGSVVKTDLQPTEPVQATKDSSVLQVTQDSRGLQNTRNPQLTLNGVWYQ